MSCAICLKNIIIGTFRLRCGHDFCTPCIYSWSSMNNDNNTFSCPLCRKLSKILLNSPKWIISGYWQEIPKDQTTLVELCENDIQALKNEFLYETINKIQNPENGLIAVVTNSVIIIGYYNSEIQNVITNCIAVQRYNGMAYPTFPSEQNFQNPYLVYKIT